MSQAVDWKQWWEGQKGLLDKTQTTLQQAWALGTRCLYPEEAFFGAYQLALRELPGVPEALTSGLWALAVTEDKRHPVVVKQSNNEGWWLAGQKRFVTQPQDLEGLVLVVSQGDGKRALRLNLDAAERERCSSALPIPGLRALTMGSLDCEGLWIANEDILPGDGHRDFSVRFRWLEDHSVLMALSGWLYQDLRRFLDKNPEHDAVRYLAEDLLMLRQALASQPLIGIPDSACRLAYAAVQRRAQAAVTAWESLMPPSGDLKAHHVAVSRLLALAEAARQRRREKAWASILAAEF